MRISPVVPLITAAAVAFGLAGCSSSTEATTALFNDSTVTADVAASSGDAIATNVGAMTDNEANAGLSVVSLPTGLSLGVFAPEYTVTGTFSWSRSKTCYDATGAVVAQCSPLSSVRKIVTHATADGSRTGNDTTAAGTTVTWSGAAHRIMDDTVLRNFNTASPPVETSRTHSGANVAHDTTTFTDATVSRVEDESAHDIASGVTFNLPRSSNPFPISGTITRTDTVHVVFSKSGVTDTRDVVRTVTVTFPPDAQGNVTIVVNGGARTCNLNLVTHKVTACH